MSEFPPENTEKRPEKSEPFMSAAAEASNLLRVIAEPRPVGDSVKQAIGRAARRVSPFLPQPMPFGRAEDIWRKEARTIRAEEMDAIRKAAKADRLAQEARNDFAELTARIARLEAALCVSDSDFARPAADALRQSMGQAHSAVDSGLGKPTGLEGQE